MRQEIDYFITAFDFHLERKVSPKEALERAAEDYAAVFHSDDGRPPVTKAIERALLAEGK